MDDSKDLLKFEYQNNINSMWDLGHTIGLFDENNIFEWELTLLGAQDSSYAKGIFHIKLKFPKNYPKNPPEILFLTPIYHLNVNPKISQYESLGHVSINFLNFWNPVSSVREILTILHSIFYLNNPESPYGVNRGEEFRNYRALFEMKAKYFTKKYANPINLIKGKKYYDKNWDFSLDQNELNQMNLDYQLISSKLNNNDENKYINILFEINGFNKTDINCKNSEITKDVIKRLLSKLGIDKTNQIFLFEGKLLNLNIAIKENGIMNNSTIVMLKDIIYC